MNLGDSRNDRCIVTGLKNVADAPGFKRCQSRGGGEEYTIPRQ